MVLVVNGVLLDEIPPDSHSLFLTFPQLKETASQFSSIPTKVVGPVGLLYVVQREFAVTVPHDKSVSILGSDDATTCIICVLRHTGSGVVGVAHFDRQGVEDGVANLTHRVQEQSLGYPEGRLELHLACGFPDAQGINDQLYYAIMHAFHKQPFEIDVVLVCVGETNSTIRGGIHCPILYGIAVNTRTGEIFPATCPDKGPDLALRQTRQFTGGQQMLDIYDIGLGLLRIGPFNYDPIRCVDLWLQQTDEFILKHLSTAPEVEPPHIVMNIRSSLKHIQEHPFPAVTLFPDNRPHYYRRDETGTWTPIRF